MKAFNLYSDEELMQEIKAGNMFAFDALYGKYCKRVYKFGISIIRKKARESEFVEYLKSVQVINVEPVNVELEYNELTNKLDEIINTLPKRQKEFYLLHRDEALKYNEISERLNISVNTIKNHMSRALKTIREKLDNYSLIAILFMFL